ncbi:phosphate ABC transporter permease subunit PstC [Sphingosinicella microcystinivorans]|uniref:phosphate ABC transporter permease subunit PstC n=1 Tax=Sphingosinicella microcystinivorans TaxID=335406 RepID=UPI0022F3F1C1|nr:phosphate ABC transporter permease subunit PstC [Sphingosinicella microcystinivorans]WBX82686.1 phosphate ABC transporter permease subunit PstC [Sphingosinicella microcystinivorans]
MSAAALILALLGLAVAAFLAARARAAAFAGGRSFANAADRIASVHSRPAHHGWYVALWALVPALILVLAWSVVGENIVADRTIASLPVESRPETTLDRQAFLAEVRGVVSGQLAGAFNPAADAAVPVYRAIKTQWSLVIAGIAALLALSGGGFAWLRVRPKFRARPRVERFVMVLLILSSLVAILTTFGIVLSLIYESVEFFRRVSPIEFLFGTNWSPQTAIRADQVGSSGAFGAVPLFWGTIFIGAIIAMIVAIPLGLMSAIYLTQYAKPQARKVMKPMLEVLAGVPTVVYGYFAALTVAPAVRDFALSIGISNASSESALAAGVVMGIMIIPFVSSMADDSITAVPAAMRDGSLAMGATTSETIKRVLIPAALPGIVGGVLLAVSRAIGETMIVVMAAGLAANLTANPFQSVTTVTAQIVQLLTGDQEFDSAKTLSAFALGLVLFAVTLCLNIYALAVVKRYREAYE